MRLGAKTVFTASILMTLLSLSPMGRASAQVAPTTLTVDPARIKASGSLPFSVSLKISNIEGLVGYDVSLEFDAQLLEVVGADVDNPPTVFAGLPHHTTYAIVDNSNGLVRGSVTALGGNSVTVTEPVPLLVITLQVKHAGISTLHIDSAFLVSLLSQGYVPYEAFDGTVISNLGHHMMNGK